MTDRFIMKKMNPLHLRININEEEQDNQFTSLYRKNILQNEDIEKEEISINAFNIKVRSKTKDAKVFNKSNKVLQAYSLSDNFYHNSIHCSNSFALAVGLSKGVYVYDQSSISRLNEDQGINCVHWNDESEELMSCGKSSGKVQLWNVRKLKKIATYFIHEERVGCIEWKNNLIVSGGKDKTINIFDTRFHKKIISFNSHKSQICSLKLRDNLLASASSDMILWDLKYNKPILRQKEKYEIKGLCWHPYKNDILFQGRDKNIRVWDVRQNQLIKQFQTSSQILNLMFMKRGEKLVSSHGGRNNQTNVWNSITMEKEIKLVGHKKRVLYLNSLNDSIVTGSGDETIKFWDIFKPIQEEEDPLAYSYEIR